ncbi:uncharacterized protein [Neodiprion pinetum]|uniref:uncharacterized protein isoform X1 n=1 Tax=Neodiprion pinetum TaxID=441929 RepID=UPI001EE11010|nr:uncharacterized protein LOC124210679 isoform X1 [Neodiprion pinetum]
MDYRERGSKNLPFKPRGAGKPKNCMRRKYYDQKNEQSLASEGSSSNHEATPCTQPPDVDYRSTKSGRDSYLSRGVRSGSSYGPRNFIKGNQRGSQMFSMQNHSSDGKYSDHQTAVSTVKSSLSAQSAEFTPRATTCNLQESSDPSLASQQNLLETGSGTWIRTDISSDSEVSRQNDRGTTKFVDETGKKSCITEVEDDLFNAPANVSLVHCVGADFRMGSGIAVQFREKFNSTGKLFDQRVKPGGVAHLTDNERYVFYLVTKQASTDKPTMDTMKQSLYALRERCIKLKVTEIAMPRIGCGLDELLWKDVKSIVEEIFGNVFVITVYHLEKDDSNIAKSGCKSKVKNEDLQLKDIEPGTGLLYIGYKRPYTSKEMRSLNEKYPFLNHLKRTSYKLGSAFRTPLQSKDIVYGLICKESENSPVSFTHLELAIQRLKEYNIKDEYEYFGLQAFEDCDDPYIMAKIETMFRNSSINAEFWICWPPSLRKKDENMQVESRLDSTEVQESSSPPLLNIDKTTKGTKNKNTSPRVEENWCGKEKNSKAEDQDMSTVQEKITAQSLSDETNSEKSKLDFTPCNALNETQNTDDYDWGSMQPQSAKLSELTDTSHNDNHSDWWDPESSPNKVDDDDSYAEAERKKSKEKEEMNRLIRQREKLQRQNEKPKSCVTECKGDLFDAEKTVSLAHCVGADFRMGSGIAVLFRQQFQSVPELLDQRASQGEVAYIQKDGRYIFYLVTKTESTGKPTYDTLKRSLLALRAKCKELNVSEIAMPRIGCGLDRLDWDKVKDMLEEIFANGFSIKIYNLQKPIHKSPNTSYGSRASWGETDNQRSLGTSNEIQRMLASVEQKICDQTSAHHELREDFQKISTTVDAVCLENKSLREYCEKLEGRLAALESKCLHEHYQKHEGRLADLETRSPDHEADLAPAMILRNPICNMRSDSTDPIYKENGRHLRSHHQNGPPPLVPNIISPQVFPSPLHYYSHAGMHLVPMENDMSANYDCVNGQMISTPKIYTANSLPDERLALLHRAQNIARRLRYAFVTEGSNGIIYLQKDKHSEPLPIYGHGDLNNLENPQV